MGSTIRASRIARGRFLCGVTVMPRWRTVAETHDETKSIDVWKHVASDRQGTEVRRNPSVCVDGARRRRDTKIWIVEDGRRLYVDRNANGDLTDDGPPLEPADERHCSGVNGGHWDFDYGLDKISPRARGRTSRLSIAPLGLWRRVRSLRAFHQRWWRCADVCRLVSHLLGRNHRRRRR